MSEPAIGAVLDALIEKLEAIDVEPPFRRKSETVPASTRAGKRWFEVDFEGHPRGDLASEGRGVQTPKAADRVAQVTVTVDYPLARSEKALERTLATDSELVLRAIGRDADWNGTPIRYCTARTATDRTNAETAEGQPGILALVVTVDIVYRDTL